MSNNKRSTLEVFGIPKEVGSLLFLFALILAASPYLGGADFGIFKVPDLPSKITYVFCYIGPIFVVLSILTFIPFWTSKPKEGKTSLKSVDKDSKYYLQRIPEIVKNEAAKSGIHIEQVRVGDRFHINDLERMCAKIYSPDKSIEEIHSVLQNARAVAFSRKYAEPREDEKLVDVSQIKLDDLKSWDTYFNDLLRDHGVHDLNKIEILYVGIGNGHADEKILSGIHSFKAADISDDALKYAREKYPHQMKDYVSAAEDMKEIPNNSVDLYLSLRTYQSTLFDRRVALHEAYRVLRSGGILVISVPIMFLKEDKKVLKGLIPPESSEPNMLYAKQLVMRIKEYLEILNFRDIELDKRSPFEIFLFARR